MSRAGYTDECDDHWQHIMWRGQVASSIRGKRGQAFLRELVAALDAMPEKRLIANELRKGGEVCALGCIGAARGVNLEALDPHDYSTLSGVFDIAEPLVREIEWENDEAIGDTPERRWREMREWAATRIIAEPDTSAKPTAATPASTTLETSPGSADARSHEAPTRTAEG